MNFLLHMIFVKRRAKSCIDIDDNNRAAYPAACSIRYSDGVDRVVC